MSAGVCSSQPQPLVVELLDTDEEDDVNAPAVESTDFTFEVDPGCEWLLSVPWATTSMAQ